MTGNSAFWSGACPYCTAIVGGTRKVGRCVRHTFTRRCPNIRCDRVVLVKLFRVGDTWKTQIERTINRFD